MRTALAAVLAFALLSAPAAAQTTDTTPTVAAAGTGTATLRPDLADFEAGVARTAATSRAARTAANTRIAAIERALRRAGVAAADIRTVGLFVERRHVRRKGHPTRIRYRASQALMVRVRTVDRLGTLLDAVADAGADTVGNPEFGFADPSEGRLLAMRAALADARRRAEDAAAQQGLRITGVRSIDLDPDSFSAEGGDSDSSANAGGGSTRVAPGTRQFFETVRVVYTATAA